MCKKSRHEQGVLPGTLIVTGAEPHLPEPEAGNPQHPGVINAFAAHLLRGEPLTADAEDGLRALQLSNAIHYSGWTGKAVSVPVPQKSFHEELEKKTAGSHSRKTGDITYESDHSGTGSRR